MTHIAANIDQAAYRWRADDGSEAGATWLELTDTAHIFDLSGGNQLCRLRFLLQETAGGGTNNFQGSLEYSLNGGAWTAVSLASAAARAFNSANLTDATDTTQQIGAGTFIAANGGVSEDGIVDGVTDFNGNDETEFEYTLELVAADLSDGDALVFRINEVDTITSTPSATISIATASTTPIAKTFTAVGIQTLTRTSSRFRTQQMTATGVASVARRISLNKTIAATGNVVLTKGKLLQVAASIVATGAVVLQQLQVAGRSAQVTAVGVLNATSTALVSRSFLAAAIGAATTARKISGSIRSNTASGTASVTKKVLLARATATTAAITFAKGLLSQVTGAATALGIPSESDVFSPYSPPSIAGKVLRAVDRAILRPILRNIFRVRS